MMRRFFFILLCSVLSLGAQAQLTAKQVMEKAAAVLDSKIGYQADITMKVATFNIKMTVAMKGKKGRFSTKDGDIWSDGVTVYSYGKDKNTITIEKADKKKWGNENSMDLKSLTTGYNMSLQNTSEGYKVSLKKLKTNKDKDAPNNAEIIVAPSTFYPKSLKFKKGILSMTITYSNIKVPITDDAVTYKSSRYPNAKVIDKR